MVIDVACGPMAYKTQLLAYEFSHPFEPPVEACTSFYFYIGSLALKATRLGRLLDPGW